MVLESNYPDMKESIDGIDIAFCPRFQRKQIVRMEFVLDINKFGDIIGIEVINLKYKLGKGSLEFLTQNQDSVDTKIRCKYDEEADAFYVRLSKEYSQDQIIVDGKFYLDDDRHIIGMEVSKLNRLG
jgi:uncharacterized protein YuzE